MNKKLIKNQKAITLISLVVTIVVLIILAGVAISLTLSQNGIFNKAKEARRLQLEAEYREKIGTDILDAQVEAISKNEELEDAQIKDIISKYGELQEDGDTIKIKDSDIQVSLKDIYNGTTSSTGGNYTESKKRIEELEKQIEDIKNSLANAITNAGVETSKDDNIDTIIGNISKIGNSEGITITLDGNLSGDVEFGAGAVTSGKAAVNATIPLAGYSTAVVNSGTFTIDGVDYTSESGTIDISNATTGILKTNASYYESHNKSFSWTRTFNGASVTLK